MYRIGMIGDRASVLGFRAVGFDVEYAHDYQTAKDALDKLAKKKYAIIFITEQIYLLIGKQLQEYSKSILPAIIVLPNNRGSRGIGMEGISKAVEKAIGVDIFSESGD